MGGKDLVSWAIRKLEGKDRKGYGLHNQVIDIIPSLGRWLSPAQI